MSSSKKRRYAIVFVCQQGKLEVQAAILAASLRRYCRLDHELIAAIPTPAELWGEPDPRTLEFFRKLGVRTVAVTNQIDPAYAIGNKIGCLSVPTDADKIILIDSDMILTRTWEDEDRFAIPFNARPVVRNSFSDDANHWNMIYAVCGTKPLPGWVYTTNSQEWIPPYFNSSFVAVPAQIGFGKAWLDCCRKIDAVAEIPNKRPFLDQIALGPAVSLLGLEYDCLDEHYTHPSSFKPLDARKPSLFFHCKDFETFFSEPSMIALLKSLSEEHPELNEILGADSQWQPFTSASGSMRNSAGLNVMVTGIPRSGTSYLCNLLHRFNNCVILNEPEEIAPGIANDGTLLPWSVPRFYRWQRAQIALGHPIRNRLVDGKVTQDTARERQFAFYQPQVQDDFVFGVKSTIPFLSRIPELRRIMPFARIVACVRNPFDCIASWKTSYVQLRDRDIEGRPVGNPGDPGFSAVRRYELGQIASIPQLAVRRAAWWRFLADLLLDSLDQVLLVNYEHLVTNPQPILTEILKGGSPGKPSEPIEPSKPRRKLEALDADDIGAIRSLCSEAAIRLGVYRANP